MTERVGDVADHHLRAEFTAGAVALQQVADGGLRADQEFVRQDVPGADQDASFLDKAAQVGLALRADLQVVVEDDGLSVEHEVPVILVVFKNVKQAVNQVDELQAELLEGEVPFAVPVGVGDEVQGAHWGGFLS